MSQLYQEFRKKFAERDEKVREFIKLGHKTAQIAELLEISRQRAHILYKRLK